MSRPVGGCKHNHLAQTLGIILSKYITNDSASQLVPNQVVAFGFYFLLYELYQLAGYRIKLMAELVVGKIEGLETSRAKPLLQNHHGKPCSPLSMHQHNGLLLFHRLISQAIQFFIHVTR